MKDKITFRALLLLSSLGAGFPSFAASDPAAAKPDFLAAYVNFFGVGHPGGGPARTQQQDLYDEPCNTLDARGHMVLADALPPRVGAAGRGGLPMAQEMIGMPPSTWKAPARPRVSPTTIP
jgi:hypothetical protein